jgi:hypothetical protein
MVCAVCVARVCVGVWVVCDTCVCVCMCGWCVCVRVCVCACVCFLFVGGLGHVDGGLVLWRWCCLVRCAGVWCCGGVFVCFVCWAGVVEHVRHVVRASSGAACGSDAGVVDRVVRSGWIVCLCVSHAVCWWWVFVLVRAVCGCGGWVRRCAGGWLEGRWCCLVRCALCGGSM